MRKSRLALAVLAAGALAVSCAAAGYLRGRRAGTGTARYDPGMDDSALQDGRGTVPPPVPGPPPAPHDGPARGQDPGPVAVANCTGGPAGLAGWIEEMFTADLAGVPGCRRSLFREIVHGGPDRMYVSLTEWDSLGCFQAWHASPASAAARAAAAADLENSRRLRPGCRYDLPLPAGRILEDLDPVILARAAFDYPFVFDPAGFRDVAAAAAPR